MIHQASALRILSQSFGSSEFTARQAAKALSSVFTYKTSFVALSQMRKTGALSRLKKGVYAIDALPATTLITLTKPEISLPIGAYATGTYALSVSLSPISSSRYLDIFVEPRDYPQAQTSLEIRDVYPQPRVHPFATSSTPTLKITVDGFSIPKDPAVSFVDLIKIVSEKRRPVSLEYEILPFVTQLVGQWNDIQALATREQVSDQLEAVVDYISKVATETDYLDVLEARARNQGKATYSVSEVKERLGLK